MRIKEDSHKMAGLLFSVKRKLYLKRGRSIKISMYIETYVISFIYIYMQKIGSIYI